MVLIDKLRVFPFKTNQIAIPDSTSHKKYSVWFYGENTTLLEAFPRLHLRRQDIRFVYVPYSPRPRVVVNSNLLKPYRELKLIPMITKLPKLTHNFFVDSSPYLEAFDKMYRPTNYRGSLISARIKNYLDAVSRITSETQKIFFYCVDVSKDIPTNIFGRRIFPILEEVKNRQQLPFDYFVLCLMNEDRTIYTLLRGPKETLPPNRIYIVNRSLQTKRTHEDSHQEAKAAAIEVSRDVSPPPKRTELDSIKKVVNGEVVSLPDILDPEQEQNIETLSIQSYLKLKPNVQKLLLTDKIDKEEKLAITAKALLYQASGDLNKSEKIVDLSKDKEKLLAQVRKGLTSDIITRIPPENSSREIISSDLNLVSINNYQEPSHILHKRQKDFQNSFRKDLQSCFKLLENKQDFTLKLHSIVESDVPVEPGDLDATYEVLYNITLLDEKNRKHEIQIKIPKLLSDGTFIINGKKKYLMYQIILDPIFFLKKWIVKLETLYATTTIESKQLKAKQYLKMRIAGPWLPLGLVMSFYLSFNEALKLFNIKYRVQSEEPQKEEYSLKLKDGYVVCEVPSEHARQFLESFKEIPSELTQKGLLEKKTFAEAIMKITQNRNSIYSIEEVLKNIMEPVSVQILKSKLLPTTFEGCVLYMSQQVVSGRIDIRNNLTNQRLRSSEVFNHQILKQILKSYNTYRAQRISGDKDAKYQCDTDGVIKDIMTSKLVRNLENVNPLEEISCLTRTTPVGPGGVADSMAITQVARGTHPSYYGNLDPMDTPEGDTIGVINQLAVGAAITNARGSFIVDQNIDKGVGVLGTSSVFVPFVNSDDGNRIQFSCSQSRQAVSIVGNEPPLCQTGFETILTPLLSTSYIRKSQSNGIIKDITPNSIVVKSDTGRISRTSLAPGILNSAQGQSAISTFNPIVKVGQRVKQDQVVAEGKNIINGTISTGTNLLIAIMGWKGFVFEDGYVISDAIIDKKLSSKHYFEKIVVVKKDDKIRFIAEEGKDTLKGEPLLVRTSTEIEELVGLDEDEIVGGEVKTKSPGGKILSIEIFPNISIKNFPILQNQYLKFRKRYEETIGEFPTKFSKRIGMQKETPSGIIIVFRLEDDQRAEVGDKIANRHGNKGVITHIEKAENMPRTPWGDPVELILNPLSIINRMNPGQLYEMYVGLIAKFTAKQLVAFGTKKTTKAIQFISKVYKGLDNTKGQKYSSDIIKHLQKMSDKGYELFIKDIYNRNYFLPIMVPQFSVPSREQIKNVMKFVGAQDSYYLMLPEYNHKTLRKAAVGYMYYNKLEMQASIKMGARSTGMYQAKTGQPTAGKKLEGGQRAGEADVNMILSHGAIHVLKEFLGPLSDDSVTKNQIISEIIQTGNASYREPKSSPTRELFSIYMTSLGLET